MKDLISSDRYHITEPLSESVAYKLIELDKLEVIQGDIDNSLSILNDIVFKTRKDITLRIYNDLSILKKLPEVEKISFVADYYQDWDILDSLKRITALSINGNLKRIKKSISFLKKYASSLTKLGLEGDFKDIETISALTNLNHLSFVSTSMDNLQFLKPLPLKYFFNYGSKIKDYTHLSYVPSLEIIYIKKDTRVKEISFIESIYDLRNLHLWYNSNIISLPNFENLNQLELIEVFQCNKLNNIDAAIKLRECCAVKIWGCKLLPRPNLGYINQKGLLIH